MALFKQGIALEDNELYEPGLMRSYEVSLDLDNVRNQVQSYNPGEKLWSNNLDWIWTRPDQFQHSKTLNSLI